MKEQIDFEKEQVNVTDDGIQSISQDLLPEALMEAGVSEFKLKDGTKVSTLTYYSARISPDMREEAFGWLRENNFADLIKNTVSASFGRDEDETANELLNELNSKGLNTTQKEWVEPMTLKAFVREQVEKGSDLPLETFNVYIGQKSKITKEK